MILVKGAWEDGEADYSEETKRCFQNWVNGQIDDTLLKQATTAVYETGVASGNLQSALNGETGLPPDDVIMLAKTYYERIMSNRGKYQMSFKVFFQLWPSNHSIFEPHG